MQHLLLQNCHRNFINLLLNLVNIAAEISPEVLQISTTLMIVGMQM